MSTAVFMPIIEGFWVKNFKGLKQIAIGSSFQQSLVADAGTDLSPYELTPLTTVIGPSGIGKSTILDVFSFLGDCLKVGLDEAIAKRGGFDAIYHVGGEGPISFGLVYRACSEPRPLTYLLNINRKKGQSNVYIETEALIYRGNQHGGASQPILLFQNGDRTLRQITPWYNANPMEVERIKRTDSKSLALGILGNVEDQPDVPQLKQHLEGFHLACYSPDNAQGLSPNQFKAVRGDRLLTEFKRLEDKHRFEFPAILEVIAKKLPGVDNIVYHKTESGKPILDFYRKGMEKPFYAQQLSEGLLRLFSHTLLFEDPSPMPLIGIEEPDAYMDDTLMRAFADAIRSHVAMMGGSQFVLTTHHPSLVDYMDPSEVWILYYDPEGVAQVIRAYDELAFQGIDFSSIGPGWYTDLIYRKSF